MVFILLLHLMVFKKKDCFIPVPGEVIIILTGIINGIAKLKDMMINILLNSLFLLKHFATNLLMVILMSGILIFAVIILSPTNAVAGLPFLIVLK